MPVPIMMRCFQLVLLANCMRCISAQQDLCPGSSIVDLSGDSVWSSGAGPSPSCTDPPVENNAQMCDGDPTSVVIQATQGTPQCLVARMEECAFNLGNLYQMDFDLIMNDCYGTWAAPLWISPSFWDGGGASGEIDMVENCPSNTVASNFAGGGNQVPWDIDPNGFSGHVTLWNEGDVRVKLCYDNEVQEDGTCPGGGEATYPNIYGANGCSQGDCTYTFISDIWNGNAGDDGYTGCQIEGQAHLDAACGFSIRNIRLGANDGTFPGKCEALTNGGGGGWAPSAPAPSWAPAPWAPSPAPWEPDPDQPDAPDAPSGADCASSPGCAGAGLMEGNCCPSDDGTWLDCCNGNKELAVV